MAAPDTSSYVLLSPDSVNLPQSRTLLAGGGIVLQDTGAAGTVTVNTNGNLANLNEFSVAGYVNYNDISNTFEPITFLAGTGINIANPAGQAAASTWSVVNNTTIQRINVQANGVPLSTRDTINLIAGSHSSITVVDNPGTGVADIRISSSGDGMPTFQWNEVEAPPGNTVDILPFNGYTLNNNESPARVDFIPPTSANVNYGDEFRVGCWNTNNIAFRLVGTGRARFWYRGFDGTILRVGDNQQAGSSIHIVCAENTNPNEAQYVVLSHTGDFVMSG